MAPVLFAVLILQELASNVICFRQNKALMEDAGELIASTLSSMTASKSNAIAASKKSVHDLAEETGSGASLLSKEEPQEEEEESEDNCPDKDMPKTAEDWVTMYKKWSTEKDEEKKDKEKALFFACLHDAEDYSKFFNVKLLMQHEEDVKPMENLPEGWVGSRTDSAETQHFLATYKDGTSPSSPKIRNLLTFEKGTLNGSDKLKATPHCPIWNNVSGSCEIYQVSKDDLPCITIEVDGEETNPDFDEAKCAKHVANTLAFFGNAEGLALYDGPIGKEFDDSDDAVDGENTAYCGFGAKMEDFISSSGSSVSPDTKEGDDKMSSQQCLMVACGEYEGKVPYDYWYKCRFDMNKAYGFPIVLVWLLFWFLLMGVIADGYLVPALVKIGRGLKMSDALLGATLLALGGAANDFMVGLASALSEVKAANSADPNMERDNETVKLWLGGVFGTGFFINTLVAALVMIFAPAEGIPVIPGVITRDICFRMGAVTMMIIFGQIKSIGPIGSCAMIAVYLIYVALTLHEANKRKAESNQWKPPVEEPMSAQASNSTARASRKSVTRASAASLSHHGKLDSAIQEPTTDAAASFAGGESLEERLKRHMGYDPDGGVLDKAGFFAAIPFRPFFAVTMATNTWDPIVSPLMPLCICIFIPYASYGLLTAITSDETMEPIFYPELYVFAAVGFLLSCAVLFFQMKATSKATYIAPSAYAWITFVTCILWLAFVANEVLDCLACISGMFGIPTMVAGMTMLAWGNCVDNVFATIGLAKAGEFGVAITGIYAAPMFNVLFGTGITLLMMTSLKTAPPAHLSEFPMDNSAVLMLCTLVVILACTLLFTMLNGWRMTRSLGAVLAILYPTVLIVSFTLGDTIIGSTFLNTGGD
jgi:sodium/potassium/calcium exchanger 6